MQNQYQEQQSVKMWQWGAGVAALGASLGIPAFVYSRWVEPFWLNVSRPRVAVRELAGVSDAWKGFKVAFLSDWHIYRETEPHPIMRQAVAKIKAERPDLVTLGGDYFTRGKWNPVAGVIVRELADAGFPVIGVMGNHDYFGRRNDHLRIRQHFEGHGARILVNDATEICYNGQRAWLVGLDDAVKGEPDLAETVRKLPRDARPLLALSHNPDYADRLPPNFAHVMLSGHTHGGQINFAPYPFHRRLNWTRFAGTSHRTRYPLGWYGCNGTRLYVGRGLGNSKWQLRFNARPELVMLEFV
jgi:uncharacterized protein